MKHEKECLFILTKLPIIAYINVAMGINLEFPIISINEGRLKLLKINFN